MEKTRKEDLPGALVEKILQAKRELQATFDAIPDPILILDKDFAIRRANKALATFLAMDVKSLVGRHCYSFWMQREKPCLQCPVRASFEQGRPVESDYRPLAPGGREFLSRSFPLGQGPEDGAVLYLRDVTEEKRLEAMLFQSEKLASLGELAAGIAHEINNPLAYVSSNLASLSEMLMDLMKSLAPIQTTGESAQAGGDVRKRSHLEKKTPLKGLDMTGILSDIDPLIADCRQGIARIGAIVKDVQVLARNESQDPVEADLNSIVESAINIAWNRIKHKAELTKDLAPLPPVRCFPGQINQVVVNLLTNAADAIEKWGTITVRTFEEDGFSCLSISDTGKGIPKEILPRIFDPFFTTKPVGQGTGLGLSIAHRIVARHRGQIAIETEPGKGSTFFVKLPRIL